MPLWTGSGKHELQVDRVNVEPRAQINERSRETQAYLTNVQRSALVIVQPSACRNGHNSVGVSPQDRGGAPEKARRGLGRFNAEDFSVRQSRVIVNRDLRVLPSDAAHARAAIAVDATPHVADPAPPLDVLGSSSPSRSRPYQTTGRGGSRCDSRSSPKRRSSVTMVEIGKS